MLDVHFYLDENKKLGIENIERIWEISRYNFSDGLKFTSLHQNTKRLTDKNVKNIFLQENLYHSGGNSK